MCDEERQSYGTTSYQGQQMPLHTALELTNSAIKAEQDRLAELEGRGQSTLPIGDQRSDTGQGNPLWPIFVVVVTWLILYFTGLLHTAFTTVPCFIEAMAIYNGPIN